MWMPGIVVIIPTFFSSAKEDKGDAVFAFHFITEDLEALQSL